MERWNIILGMPENCSGLVTPKLSLVLVLTPIIVFLITLKIAAAFEWRRKVSGVSKL